MKVTCRKTYFADGLNPPQFAYRFSLNNQLLVVYDADPNRWKEGVDYELTIGECPEPTPRLDQFEKGEKQGFG